MSNHMREVGQWLRFRSGIDRDEIHAVPDAWGVQVYAAAAARTLMLSPNSALLTHAYLSALRASYGGAKRGR